MPKSQIPFTMLRRSIWNSEKFTNLSDRLSQVLYFYYLSSPHQNNVGCCFLKEAYALDDLRLGGSPLAVDEYRKARAELIGCGLIMADDTTQEILVPKWWQGNGPTNAKWIAGARRQCDAIKSDMLRKAARDSLEAEWAEFVANTGPDEGTGGRSVSTALLARMGRNGTAR